MTPIEIHGNTWDPELPGGPTPALDAAGSNYILLQTTGGPLMKPELNDIEPQGVDIRRKVGQYVYLCRYEPKDLAWLRAKPYLKHVDIYHPFFVIDDRLRAFLRQRRRSGAMETDPPEKIRIRIGLHEQTDEDSQRVLFELKQRNLIDTSDSYVCNYWIDAHATAEALPRIAEHDDTYMLSLAPETRLLLNKATEVVGLPGFSTGSDVNATGGNMPKKLTGDGQVINIVDSGFDRGSRQNCHPAFNGQNLENFYISNLTLKQTFDDDSGHGTIVAGCALADGSSAVAEGHGMVTSGRIRGPAPEARFTVFQVAETGFNVRPDYFDNLVGRPYGNNGCRISNHSYGDTFSYNIQQRYDAGTEVTDRFMHEHQDMVTTWANGNDGEKRTRPGFGHTTREPAAKNVISVGWTQNRRPTTPRGSRWHDQGEPLDITRVSSGSSRGPTAERGIKPDVVAPGQVVLSTRSRGAADATITHAFQDSREPDLWTWSCGSSSAAPIVAGCAALLRQALLTAVPSRPGFPSGFLIKALLVNGAVDIERRASPWPQIPNHSQGFGRVDMQGALRMVYGETTANPPARRTAGFRDVIDGSDPDLKRLDAGERCHFTVDIPPPQALGAGIDRQSSHTLKATLCWYDRPGNRLEDELFMQVHASDGTYKYGNHNYAGALRQDAQDRVNDPAWTGWPDVWNNVQQVVWQNMPPGPARIEVRSISLRSTFTINYAVAWMIEETGTA